MKNWKKVDAAELDAALATIADMAVEMNDLKNDAEKAWGAYENLIKKYNKLLVKYESVCEENGIDVE